MKTGLLSRDKQFIRQNEKETGTFEMIQECFFRADKEEKRDCNDKDYFKKR